MKVDSKQYWTWVKNQRIKDIEAEEAIDTPDEMHMKLLKRSLREAQNKINEIDGI
jgi:hypothetical protein|tara:strand:+ start:73 stop:237 length:165 start_codon:yes stop_codon:yes gene_type:complete